jgi:fatty-acyl-CoA synthase
VDALSQVRNRLFVGKTLTEVGIVRPLRPDKVARMAVAYANWGPSPALGSTIGAIRHPDRVAVIDELGTLAWKEVDERTNALANAFAEQGIGTGDGVAILCRNHRGFVETTVALAKLGARALYLNTMFAAPQVTDVVKREGPVALVYDEEFSEMVAEGAKGHKRFIAWYDGPDTPDCPIIEELIEHGDRSAPSPPESKGRFVILTSGTTGTPKGANRETPDNLDPIASLFDKIPMRAGATMTIAAPLFHSWGFLHFNVALGLGAPIVLRRTFDPELTLSDTAQHRSRTLVVVPVMLSRILELGDETIRKYDLSALETINASGSALPGELATRVMDVFGDKLYNLYGSTEVAWATIATPEDLRAAPGTAGRPPRGTVVKLLFGVWTRDIDCGFKLLRTDLIHRLDLRAPGALINTEILALARRHGATVAEVGVCHYPRPTGEQSGGSLRVVARSLDEMARLWLRLRAADRTPQPPIGRALGTRVQE